MKTLEGRLDTREMRGLRKEIIRLKREVAQLRKKNARLECELHYEPDPEEEVEPIYKKKESKDRFTCPSCESYDVLEFTAGVHDFYSCGSCETRGRKPSKAI